MGWMDARAVNQTRRLGGDSETRTPERAGEETRASRWAVPASWRQPSSRSIGHFQQVHAAALLTGRAESSQSDYLAPQTAFGPATFRLTAEIEGRLRVEFGENALHPLDVDFWPPAEPCMS